MARASILRSASSLAFEPGQRSRVRRLAQSGSIRKGADTIDRECNAVQTGVDRLLSQALDALAGVAIDVADAGVCELDATSSEGVA